MRSATFSARAALALVPALVPGLTLALLTSGCPRSSPPMSSSTPVEAAARATRADVAEVLFDGGYQNGWQDWGWTPKELVPKGPAKVRFDNYGGWLLAKPGLTGDFGGVLFRVLEPAGEGEFLEVHLVGTNGTAMGKVKVGPDDRVAVGDGWTEVFIPMDRLAPGKAPFDRVVLQAFRPFGAEPVPVDKIALTKAVPRVAGQSGAPSIPAAMTIDCRAKSLPVNPLIYGIVLDKGKATPSQLHATAVRWGGNLTTTYNHEIDAWNAGDDWFYENRESGSAGQFLQENVSHGMKSALTVPIMGWVSKDRSSYSFPVAALGPQERVDPYRNDVGNGKDKSGKPITTSPDRAYVPITPAYVKKWIEAIRKEDAKTGKRSVDMYILDNEPMAWPKTHRDAHPDPTSYDELVNRTIEYGTAIRQADPDAVIAGPAEWGWTGYFYSAKDIANGGPSARPDRRAHGDLPVVAYYLKALADYEKKTGIRVLDVLDLHNYPAADGVYSEAADPAKAALRIRSTRLLWDPRYTDESWIHEPIKLLPRMREWVDQNYPGRGISIGEWNFGGEQHMSGALAIAETFGRFAQFGVTSAFYFTSPPQNTPGMWAFRAYRDFDAKGGRFLDWTAGTTVDHVGQQSLFASRDESGKHLVAIALNFSPNDDAAAEIDLSSCGKVASVQTYSYAGGTVGFTATPPSPAASPTKLNQTLLAYSITVFDVQLGDAVPVAK